MQIGLVDMLKAEYGIEPAGMLGHSAGEIACGYADGCLTREQTVLIAYHRGAFLPVLLPQLCSSLLKSKSQVAMPPEAHKLFLSPLSTGKVWPWPHPWPGAGNQITGVKVSHKIDMCVSTAVRSHQFCLIGRLLKMLEDAKRRALPIQAAWRPSTM